jgi:hypothetical protein
MSSEERYELARMFVHPGGLRCAAPCAAPVLGDDDVKSFYLGICTTFMIKYIN